MFKSRIDENLKADEIFGGDEGLCYEIVRNQEEKPLTLQEARKLVEQNCLLNKRELADKLNDIFGTSNDGLLSQYLNTNAGDADDIVTYDPSDRDSSAEDEVPKYTGRGLLGATATEVEETDEDSLLDDSDEISSTVSFNRRAEGEQRVPMTSYAKGPPPSWSNVFANSSSDDD